MDMSENLMRAIRYHQNGEANVLQLEEVQRPQPGEGDVLVRVSSAGINPNDSTVRRGLYGNRPLPTIPGADLAGIVEAVGPGVTEYRPGQEVFGLGRGTYAEYALAPSESLAPKPPNLSFDEAASVMLAARTAWSGLFNLADLQPGQRVLVHGAAGGVGIYVVQLAKWRGAEVIGTASAANLDLVRSLGADTVIDYNVTPFESVVHDVDIVYSTAGGDTVDRSWQVLKPGGWLVYIAAGQVSEETAQEHGARAGRPGVNTAQPDWAARIAELLVNGVLRPVVRAVFPLEQARQATELSETGHGRGHIVLHVRDA